MRLRMSASKLSECRFVVVSVIIFIHEKPLSTVASDCGTNKYNSNSFLIFQKAASIIELPTNSLTVSGAFFLGLLAILFLFLSLFFVICTFFISWLLLMQD